MRIPLYKQIQTYIVDHIQQGIWKPDSKIPSENELAEQFNVSRITIKKALDDLVEEGLIYRIQGKGSFIAANSDGEPTIYNIPASKTNLDQKLIAVVTPHLSSELASDTYAGIETTLAKHGYKMIICQTHDSQKAEEQIIKEVRQLGVAGIIIYPVEGETYNEEVLRLTLKDFPVVLIDRYFRGIEVNSVSSDNHQGSYEAICHLIGLGHSRIGMISTSYQGTTSIEDRIIGYEKALTDKEVPIDHHLYLLNPQKSGGNKEIRENTKKKIQAFIRNNPDMSAIFAITSGIEVLEAIMELGLQIPEDLSLTMFDDSSLSHFFKTPPTCVKQQGYTIGEEAANLLVSSIEKKGQKRKKIFIPTELIVRQSTAAYKIKSK